MIKYIFPIILLVASCCLVSTDLEPNGQTRELVRLINSTGGRAEVNKEGVIDEVHIGNGSYECITYINRVRTIEYFYIADTTRVVPTSTMKSLAKMTNVKCFHVLYGTVSSRGFSYLEEKFPNVEEVTLWGDSDSDLLHFPKLRKLKAFSSDYAHFLTINEARRLYLSSNLESVSIERADSVEVFNLLKRLPNIKELDVKVYGKEGEVLSYTL